VGSPIESAWDYSAHWKSEKRQALGMHFDGIVAGLEAQRQKKMAKKWRRLDFSK
jgi:hypothetical protein